MGGSHVLLVQRTWLGPWRGWGWHEPPLEHPGNEHQGVCGVASVGPLSCTPSPWLAEGGHPVPHGSGHATGCSVGRCIWVWGQLCCSFQLALILFCCC